MSTFAMRGDRRNPRRLAAALTAWAGICVSPAVFATSPGPFELRVVVEESPADVRVHVLLPEGFPAESINVETAGHELVVQGRDRDGVSMRSRPIRLSHRVRPDGAEVRFEADGSLTITLRVADGGS